MHAPRYFSGDRCSPIGKPENANMALRHRSRCQVAQRILIYADSAMSSILRNSEQWHRWRFAGDRWTPANDKMMTDVETTAGAGVITCKCRSVFDYSMTVRQSEDRHRRRRHEVTHDVIKAMTPGIVWNSRRCHPGHRCIKCARLCPVREVISRASIVADDARRARHRL